MRDFALLAQDEIHVTPRLTISPGVRFEYTTLPQPAAPLPLGSLNIPVDWPETAHPYYKAGNWAPRIGIAYTIDSKTVVRAGYGMFYNRYISQITDGLAKGNGSYQPSYSLSSTVGSQFAAGPVFPSNLSTEPSGAANAPTIQFDIPGFRNAYSEQAQISVQRELDRNTSLTVSGIWSRGLHIASAYNANLGTPTQSYPYAIDNAAGSQVGSFTVRLYTRANLINPNYNGVYAMSSNANIAGADGLIISVNHHATEGRAGLKVRPTTPGRTSIDDDNLGVRSGCNWIGRRHLCNSDFADVVPGNTVISRRRKAAAPPTSGTS